MTDALYITGTVAFFALMLAFTRGAATLGAQNAEPNDDEPR
jgi:hypothetical protein